MSKERLEETDFEEIWKPVKSVIEYYRMDYGEAVTIGGQFGVLKREIKLLQQQNKRYREKLSEINRIIDVTPYREYTTNKIRHEIFELSKVESESNE